MKKTLEQWEKEKGFMIRVADPKQEMTEEEFDSIPWDNKFGMNHADRTEFLTKNGYEVNRENMINADLHAVQPQETEEGQ